MPSQLQAPSLPTATLTPLGGKRILFVMAVDAEYGPHLRRLFQPLMTGVGPVEAAVALAGELGRMRAIGELPDLIVSLGSAGSHRLEQTEVYQAISVSYRDMDASALGFPKRPDAVSRFAARCAAADQNSWNS